MKLSNLILAALVGFAALSLAPVVQADEISPVRNGVRRLHGFEHDQDFDHGDDQGGDDNQDGGDWDSNGPDGENENGEFGPADHAFGGFDWGEDHEGDNEFPGGDDGGDDWEGAPEGGRRSLRSH